MQEARIGDEMVWGPHYMVADIARHITLLPGDVILTGTPTKLGQAEDGRKWLKAGDVFEMTVPEIGTLKNVVKDEK